MVKSRRTVVLEAFDGFIFVSKQRTVIANYVKSCVLGFHDDSINIREKPY